VFFSLLSPLIYAILSDMKNGKKKLPPSFKPLLWSLRWSEIDVEKDKADIILNAINEGTLAEWRWLINAYGKKTINQVLKKRLAGEFHPESLNLATVIFSLPKLPYARRSSYPKSRRLVSQTR